MHPHDISPFALIHPKAQIGKRVAIGAGTVIGEGTIIEDDVSIGGNCFIGGPPESKNHWDDFKFRVLIEKKAVISNLVTIDSGTERFTTVGESSIILAHAHLGHDAILFKHCTVACGVTIGGFVVLMEHVNVGLNVSIHQKKIIPPYVMLGMGTVVTKHSVLGAYRSYAGNPCSELGMNKAFSPTTRQHVLKNKDYLKLRGKMHDHF